MATKFKEGDRVQIIDREATAEDAKSGLFYHHLRGLIGTVLKVYPTEEASVEIELESLPEAVAQRHLDVQEQMKTRWLDGLSEEGRNRLTEKERDFRLRYTVLVAVKDLTAPGKRAVTAAPPKAVATAPAAAVKPAPVKAEEAPRRPTSADYDAAEEAYFQSRQRTGGE
ncbi:MAG TPA: hypothetical protein VFB21_03785 [Chthonomonadaceae bacterium]|nr:hypothetical protein [Chthonomonadaceae bacterium]